MNHSRTAYAYLILAASLWGGNYIVGKLLVSSIAPVTLSWFRWAPAMLIVVWLYRKQIRQQWAIIQGAIGKITLLSVLGVIAFPTTLYQGLQTTSSLNASLYLATVPSLVIILNTLFFKEKITTKAIIGSSLSFLGVLILISKGNPSTLLRLNFSIGDAWAILSAVSWACYCSLIKIKPQSLTTGSFLGASLAIGVLLLTPIWLAEIFYHQLTVSYFSEVIQNNFVALIYLIIGPSVMSYWLWNKGLGILGTAKGALFNHIIPLSAALIAVLFMGEHVYFYHLFSVTAIVCGILLSQKGKTA